MRWSVAIVAAMLVLATRAHEITDIHCTSVHGQPGAQIVNNFWLAPGGSSLSYMTFENDDPVYFFMGRAYRDGNTNVRNGYRIVRNLHGETGHVQTSLFLNEQMDGAVLIDMGVNDTSAEPETSPYFAIVRYLVVKDTLNDVAEEFDEPCPEEWRTLDVLGRRTRTLYPSRYLYASDRAQVMRTILTANCLSTSAHLGAFVVYSVDFPSSPRAVLRVTQVYHDFDDPPEKHLLYLASRGGEKVAYSEVSAIVTQLSNGTSRFNVTIQYTEPPYDSTIHLWVSPKGVKDDPNATSAYYVVNSLTENDDDYTHDEVECSSIYQNIAMAMGSVVAITSPEYPVFYETASEDPTPEATTSDDTNPLNPYGTSPLNPYTTSPNATRMTTPTPHETAPGESTADASYMSTTPTSAPPSSHATTMASTPSTVISTSSPSASSVSMTTSSTITTASTAYASTSTGTTTLAPQGSTSSAADDSSVVTASSSPANETTPSQKVFVTGSTTTTSEVTTSLQADDDGGTEPNSTTAMAAVVPGTIKPPGAEIPEEDPWPSIPLYNVQIVNSTLTTEGMLTATCIAIVKAPYAAMFRWHVGANTIPAINEPPPTDPVFNGNMAWRSRLQTVVYGISPSTRVMCTACTLPPAQSYCMQDVDVVVRHGGLTLNMQFDLETVSVVCLGLEGVSAIPRFNWTVNGIPVHQSSVWTARTQDDYETTAQWQSRIPISRISVPLGHRDVYECTATLADEKTIKATKSWSNIDYLTVQKNGADRPTFLLVVGIITVVLVELL